MSLTDFNKSSLVVISMTLVTCIFFSYPLVGTVPINELLASKHSSNSSVGNSSVGISSIRISSIRISSVEGKNFSCPNCLLDNRQQAEQLKMEAIKTQILSKLNLPDRPKVNSHLLPKDLITEALRKAQLSDSYPVNTSPLITSYLSTKAFKEYQPASSINEEDTEDSDTSSNSVESNESYYGQTAEIIAFSEKGQMVNGHSLLEFIPPHDNVHRLEVTSATLWVQIRLKKFAKGWQHWLKDHMITLYVFRVKPVEKNINLNVTSNEEVKLPLEVVATHKIRASRAGWKHIDLKESVQQWFSSSSSSEETTKNKFTLLIDCVGCDNIIDIIISDDNPVQKQKNKSLRENLKSSTNKQKQSFRPFMVIATRPKRSKRSRRHTSTCNPKQKECCKQSLYVDFKDLGWDDWIIAPKGYHANYCMGDCSKRRTPDTYVHFHSHVIEEYRNKNPYASISPCCAPTKLAPISLIYFDADLNIIKADLPKMVVEQCGCT